MQNDFAAVFQESVLSPKLYNQITDTPAQLQARVDPDPPANAVAQGLTHD